MLTVVEYLAARVQADFGDLPGMVVVILHRAIAKDDHQNEKTYGIVVHSNFQVWPFLVYDGGDEGNRTPERPDHDQARVLPTISWLTDG